nr:histidine kinase dimerization/phosphoacceptor domain -containing protein [Caulobacter hibisci]
MRYVLATAVVLAFFAVRSVFAPVLGGYPFLLFFPAIILISVALDRGTGMFSVFLSAILAWYFFLPPVNSFALPDAKAAVPLALYLSIAFFLAAVVEALRSTARRLAQTADKLERSNEFNRLLLLDVNHRVKNHLTSITGLLRLSAREIDDPRARSAIENAVGRIGVLGQVYERLHLGERATVVSSRDFIVSLCEGLRQSVLGMRPIALRVQAEDVALSSTQAVPIGLVINELVENALKYAFPDDRAGDIRVIFGVDQDNLVLSVRDDGMGSDPAARPGGGTRIVGSLVQQLGGVIRRQGPPGTEVIVTLPRQAPEEDAA